MLIKFRYVGTTTFQYTNGVEYVVIASDTSGCQFIKPDGSFGGEGWATLSNTALWELVSISTVGVVQIYP